MAQAILLQPVETLGDRGDVIDVSDGYLRNYLAPRKLAQPATPASIAEAQRRHEAAERAAAEQVQRAEENAALLRRSVAVSSAFEACSEAALSAASARRWASAIDAGVAG